MFWDGETVWTQNFKTGVVKKLNSISKKTDWEPAKQGSDADVIFRNKAGLAILPPYQIAINESPVQLAFRINKYDQYQVVTRSNNFYRQAEVTNRFIKTNLNPGSYKDWKPVLLEHILAELEFEGIEVEFRDPRFPPPIIAEYPGEIDCWHHTGTSPKLEEHKKQTELEIRKHNESISNKQTNFVPKNNSRTLAPPEIIAAVGPMTTAVASSIHDMMQINEKEIATLLAKSLARLVDNASWHLREDRSKYNG